ncbi:DUF2946 domain-containing protein [Undibacterium sp. CCC3.4]|nr:DUF2946 domain-containing protein [Undibacterium sp. CCC3.4]WPX41909.1 DUF2946 domain-containing protein [Undibacterium sp. CCC3.4]
MPSISAALAANNGAAGWLEICSSKLSPVVKADVAVAGKTAPLSDQGKHGEHCAYCFTSAASFALPPMQLLSIPVVVQQLHVPRLFYRSPSPLFVWTSIQSRAPPRLV